MNFLIKVIAKIYMFGIRPFTAKKIFDIEASKFTESQKGLYKKQWKQFKDSVKNVKDYVKAKNKLVKYVREFIPNR